MKNNFAKWLAGRDRELAEAIANEGFTDWVRRHPSISKGLSMGVMTGALGHSAETLPLSHGAAHTAPHEEIPHGETPHGEELHGNPPMHSRPPAEHAPEHEEDHKGKAEIELMFHYVGENVRRQLEAIARKWKKSPSDPGFKRWLLRLFKRITNIRRSLTPDSLRELPAQVGSILVSAADREFKRVKDIFSELPDVDPDYDVERMKQDLDTSRRTSTGRPDENPGFSSVSPRMDRSNYRHRKQDRRGF